MKRSKRLTGEALKEFCENNPLLALTDVPRQFLKDLGINSCFDFLSRTTYWLAAELIEWRVKNLMQPLKKHSSLTTISGWKADVSNVTLHNLFPVRFSYDCV